MKRFGCLVIGLLLAGCSAYSWRPAVPADLRSITVPTFRNESDVTGLGSAVTRQTLRELQREGTFAIARPEDAALEIQGVVRTARSEGLDYDRAGYQHKSERRCVATAVVSLIDRRGGRVLIDNRPYEAEITFLSGGDDLTAEHDASGRLAEEFARQIVDDILDFEWERNAE